MPRLKSQIRFMGVDPGNKGGLAIIDKNARVISHISIEESTWEDIWGWIAHDHWEFCDKVILEKVHAFPGQGVSSMFTFGENYGMLQAFLIASEIPRKIVMPADWQGYFDIPPRKSFEKEARKTGKPSGLQGRMKSLHKEAIRQECEHRFPDLNIWWEKTLTYQRAVCDALLMAEYARRTT